MREFFGKILSVLSLRERLRLGIQLLLLIGMAFVDVIGIASILPFMAVVSNPDVIHSNKVLAWVYDGFGFTSLPNFLLFLGVMVLLLLVFGNVFKTVYTWVSLKFDNHLVSSLTSRLLASYMVRPYESFLVTNSAEMRKNVLSEAGSVVAGILSPGMQILSNGLLCLFILALLMVVDPFVAIAIIVVLGGTYAVIYLLARHRLAWMGKEQVRANFLKFRSAGEALAGIKDIKILGRERIFLDRFAVHARNHAKFNTSVGVISQVPRYALETMAFGGIMLIVLYSLGEGGDVGDVVPLLSMYAFAGYRLMPSLQQLFASFSAVRVSIPALEMLHRDMNEKVMAADPEVILPGFEKINPLPLKSELALEGISFSYHGARESALKGIDLVVPACSLIGFVGASGSGKTTIVDIILGLLTPTSGRITVDGVEINAENIAAWRSNIGYVAQQIYLCDDTIANNIAFGVPEHELDMEQVKRAARAANLHDFVEGDLADGYETLIGERGVRLSGGQRQRIGIARALYRDPAVLIMDEATSALDGITEKVVMDAVSRLSGKKTIILIAHRLTTVKDCDAIYLMEKGRVISQGTYHEMMESSIWFKEASRSEPGS